MKKYEFTGETKKWIRGKTLYRIRSLRDFGEIHAGELGGFIEKEVNLSHDGNAWVDEHAVAYGDCRIYGNALITGTADISGNTHIFGDAIVGGQTHIGNGAWICGNAMVSDRRDYMFLCGVGTDGKNLTCFRGGDGNVWVKVHADFFDTADKLKKYAFEHYGNGQGFVEFRTVLELIRQHFGLIKAEK